MVYFIKWSREPVRRNLSYLARLPRRDSPDKVVYQSDGVKSGLILREKYVLHKLVKKVVYQASETTISTQYSYFTNGYMYALKQ